MDQEKIGKFISECRKNKKMTQSELAEKLGVSDKSVSKWETGKCMPDLSLFKLLCEELEITINELLSGEKIDKKDYQSKLEENIVNIVNYSDKKSDIFGYLLFSFIGLISLIFGISFHSTNNLFPVLFELFGIVLIIMGLNKLIVNTNIISKIVFLSLLFIILFSIVELIDIGSIGDTTPKYYYNKSVVGDCVVYKKISKNNIVYKNNEYVGLEANDMDNFCKSNFNKQ